MCTKSRFLLLAERVCYWLDQAVYYPHLFKPEVAVNATGSSPKCRTMRYCHPSRSSFDIGTLFNRLVRSPYICNFLMAQAARISPKFPWDYDVSGNPFWDSFGGRAYKLERCFASCYTQDEVSQMTFDNSLNETQKLEFLRSVLQTTLDSNQAPLHDTDYTSGDY
jgi:hypothetical protein